MAITVVCPKCGASFEITRDLRDQPVRCMRCEHTFTPGEADPLAVGIQTTPIVTPPAKKYEQVLPPAPSPPRATARTPFPAVPLLVCVVGMLFFLLVGSGGFNVWFLTHPDDPWRRRVDVEQANQRAAMAEARAQAEAAAAAAAQAETQRVRKQLQDQIDDLKQALEAAKKEAENLRQNDKINADSPVSATLEGRVTLKGPMPKIATLKSVIKKHNDHPHLMKAPNDQLLEPTWRIDPKSNGIADVCVFIKRPANAMLPIHADDKVRKAPIVMETPFGMFVPHMTAVYAEWNDGRKQGKTGQEFWIENKSPIPHSARITTGPMFGRTLPPIGKEKHDLPIRNLPHNLQCDFHPWMGAYVWSFDHPYFAITKADGTFTIPRAPTGMEVQVMAWHESQGWLFTKDGKSMKLNPGKNVLDFEITAK